jgi:hypothetical protein
MTNQEKQLVENLHKKFQTTMIGSLARFEKVFGYLWENDTAEADKFLDMWEYARNSILNNGNKQARAAIEDLISFFNHDKLRVNTKFNYKINFDNKGDDI